MIRQLLARIRGQVDVQRHVEEVVEADCRKEAASRAGYAARVEHARRYPRPPAGKAF